ncbi:hypothetical protein VZT92_021283 [Zoarces viviparus]|uniref:Uncharacterized protein n=1 Tax=Zoarces viviparus TaxID=48416 RepID=A0AAW1EHP8_ZOAVI
MEVECVATFEFQAVHISKDFSWTSTPPSEETDDPQILANVYRYTIESIFTNWITMATALSLTKKHCRG